MSRQRVFPNVFCSGGCLGLVFCFLLKLFHFARSRSSVIQSLYVVGL